MEGKTVVPWTPASPTPTHRCWALLENVSRAHSLEQACKYWSLGAGSGTGSGGRGRVPVGLLPVAGLGNTAHAFIFLIDVYGYFACV